MPVHWKWVDFNYPLRNFFSSCFSLRPINIIGLIVVVYCFSFSGTAIGQEVGPIKIGVLAYKGKPSALKRWSQHGKYLNKVLAPLQFQIIPLGYKKNEFTLAVEHRKVDFVITNPGHYTELWLGGHVTHLSTRRMRGPKGMLDQFGGTAITRPDRKDLVDYADFYNQLILIPSRSSLGGWQVHLGEGLAQGIDLRKDAQVTEMKNHRLVVSAILDGKADAGLIRSDLIEELIAEKIIKKTDLRIINRKNVDNYPYLLSTRLYPEWPFAAVTGVSNELAASVLVALLDMPEDSIAAESAGIMGWTIPGDYSSVHELFHEAGLGPFATQELTFRNFITKYWVVITAIALIVVAFLSISFIHILRSRKALQHSETLLQKSQEIAHIGSWYMDLGNGKLYWSDEVYRIFGVDPAEFRPSYDAFLAMVHQGDRNKVDVAYRKAIRMNMPYEVRHRIVRADGSIRVVWEKSEEVNSDKGQTGLLRGIVHDITEQAEAEKRLKQAASVFQHASEAIVITDADVNILDVNNAFMELTGYAKEEVVGKNPKFLQSGRQSPEFYEHMWQTLIDDGLWQGEVWNRKKNGEIFAERLTISVIKGRSGNISHYVGLCSDITEAKERQHKLEFMAHHDALTQLPNRTLLGDRMQQALAHANRNETLLVVAYLDLDGFKPVNDELGHDIGDRLLVEISKRLKSCVRADDTVARLGGDEFVLLLSDIRSVDECELALSRVLKAIEEPSHIQENSISVSASIGGAIYPLDDVDADTLLRHSDQAMYVAKQAGRNRFHLFDPHLDKAVVSFQALRQRIEEALHNNEFILYFQPIVDIKQGRVLGAEALIRWQHPEEGLITPMQFLPTIDETDFAAVLGLWVIEESMRQLEAWNQAGLELSVNINVTRRLLIDGDFIADLEKLLQRFPEIAQGQIELEVLETTALEDMGKISEIIEGCQKLGVHFALDDFGTGYSSLSYFRRLPVDTLKIDQTFIREMLLSDDDYAIVDGVIGLTRSFQRRVIAEGVETTELSLALLQMGCYLIQGHDVAKPMSAEQFIDWVDKFEPDPLWAKTRDENWTKDDMPLLLVKKNHYAWVDRMVAYLESSEEQGLEHPTLNHHQCHFGRWYDGIGYRCYGHMPEYTALGPIHEQLHEVGLELVQLKDEGLIEQVTERLPELLSIRKELIGYITHLLEKVQEQRKKNPLH